MTNIRSRILSATVLAGAAALAVASPAAAAEVVDQQHSDAVSSTSQSQTPFARSAGNGVQKLTAVTGAVGAAPAVLGSLGAL